MNTTPTTNRRPNRLESRIRARIRGLGRFAGHWRNTGESVIAIASVVLGSVDADWLATLLDCLDYIEVVRALPVIFGSLVVGIYSGWRLMAARKAKKERKPRSRPTDKDDPPRLWRILRPVFHAVPVGT